MSTRAGYDVVEVMYVKEATYGVKPTGAAAAWLHAGRPVSFNPKIQKEVREKIGLGNQQPTDFVKAKEFAEASWEYILLSKRSSPAWEWITFHGMVAGSPYTGLAVTNHLDSYSLGAKLDIATDEFWLLTGCKTRSHELKMMMGEEIRAAVDIVAQKGVFNTADYVEGAGSSRETDPASQTPILFSDCDVKYGGSSVLKDLQDLTFTLSRDLDKLGSDPTTKTLYRELFEKNRRMEVKLTRDFDSTTEYADFINHTQFTLDLEIPTGSGGRKLSLTGGRWLDADPSVSENDLISLSLTAQFTGLTISAIA